MPVLGMENPDYRYVNWDEARMQQEEQREIAGYGTGASDTSGSIAERIRKRTDAVKRDVFLGICMERRGHTQAESVGIRIKASGNRGAK